MEVRPREMNAEQLEKWITEFHDGLFAPVFLDSCKTMSGLEIASFDKADFVNMLIKGGLKNLQAQLLYSQFHHPESQLAKYQCSISELRLGLRSLGGDENIPISVSCSFGGIQVTSTEHDANDTFWDSIPPFAVDDCVKTIILTVRKHPYDSRTPKIIGYTQLSIHRDGSNSENIQTYFSEELSGGSGRIEGMLAFYNISTSNIEELQFSPIQLPKVAIIGMGFRFPAGCEDWVSYWDLLSNGKSGISSPPQNRLSDRNDITKKAGFISDISAFDARFFRISPKEAMGLDPMQTHLLESTWEAMEDACIIPSTLVGSKETGVFIGTGFADYFAQCVCDADSMSRYTPVSIIPCMLANRLSFTFGLQGPSVVYDTACASALTACHYGASSLQLREVDIAVCGGSNFLVESNFFVAVKIAGMTSPTGVSRPFDANANGYVRGEGAGIAILKRFKDALLAGDPILAVVEGSGINANGSSGSSFTAPSPAAQVHLCRTVCKNAGVDPASVRYIEAHGTSTSVGDPIEAGALESVFSTIPGRSISFSIGSVKSNIGHLEAASGMASLAKVILMMHHETLVPSINVEQKNPKITVGIQTVSEPLFSNSNRALLGINSFGLGGSNCHMMLSTWKPKLSAFSPIDTSQPLVVPLSAFSIQALQQHSVKWADIPLSDLHRCAAIQALYRQKHKSRVAFICSAMEFPSCVSQFASLSPKEIRSSGSLCGGCVHFTEAVPRVSPSIGIVFSGQGTQWDSMGVQLYSSNKIFRDIVQRCDATLQELGAPSLLLAGLCSKNPPESWSSELSRLPSLTVLSIGVIELALWELWCAVGIKPSFVVGHSMGECIAAYASGAISQADALLLLWVRGRLMDTLIEKNGAMIAVSCSAGEARQLLSSVPKQYIACLSAVNSPNDCTISCDASAVEVIQKLTSQRKISCIPLRVSCAFHSPHLDSLKTEFLESIAGIGLRWTTPTLSIYSTVTGSKHEGPFDEQFWWKNVRNNVQFASVFSSESIPTKANILLEVGPHSALHGYLRKLAPTSRLLASMRKPSGNTTSVSYLHQSIGALFTSGLDISWRILYPYVDRSRHKDRTFLPSHPWDHAHHHLNRPVGTSSVEFAKKKGMVFAQNIESQSPDPVIIERIVEKPVERIIERPATGTSTGPSREVSLKQYPFLRAHVIDGALIFPASMYLALALATVHGDNSSGISDVSFSSVLVANRRTDSFHVSQMYDGRSFSFRHGSAIYSRGGCLSSVQTVSECDMLFPANLEVVPAGLAAARSSCSDTIVTREQFYDSLAARKMAYAEELRCLRDIQTGDDEAIGEIDAQETVVGVSVAHPAILEACMQLLAACVEVGTEMMLPHGVGYLWCPSSLPSTRSVFVAHARICGGDASRLVGNVDLYDKATGKLLLVFRGLELSSPGDGKTPTAELSWLFHTQVHKIASQNVEDVLVSDSSDLVNAVTLAATTLTTLQVDKIIRILDIGGHLADRLPEKLLAVANKPDSCLRVEFTSTVLTENMKKAMTGRSYRNGPWFKYRVVDKRQNAGNSKDLSNLELRPFSYDIVVVSSVSYLTTGARFVADGSFLICASRGCTQQDLLSLPDQSSSILSKNLPWLVAKLDLLEDTRNPCWLIVDGCKAASPLVDDLCSVLPSSHVVPISSLGNVLTGSLPSNFTGIIDPRFAYETDLTMLLEILQLVDKAKVNCPLVVVTSGSGTDRFGCIPESSALSGFCRSARNEVIGHFSLITVDIGNFPISSLTTPLKRLFSTISLSPKDITEFEYVLRPSSTGSELELCNLRVVPTTLPDVPSGNGFAVERRNDRLCARPLSLDWMKQRLGPNEILIEVQKVCLQFKDAVAGLGLLKNVVTGHSLGVECEGRVVQCGSQVDHTKYAPGTCVLATHPHGTLLAKFISIPQDFVFVAPRSSSLGICGHWQTAYWGLLELGNLKEGQIVLIHCGAGGVGQAAIRLAIRAKATVITTAGSAEKRKSLSDTYPKIALVSDSRNPYKFTSDVRAFTHGRGVDVILNSLSGESLQASLELLANGGRFIDIGKLDAISDTPIGMKKLMKNGSFFCLQTDTLFPDHAKRQREIVKEIIQLLDCGELEPLPLTLHPISELLSVLKNMASGKTSGLVGIDISTNSPAIGLPVVTPQVISSSGAYIITGAFGGIGWWLALWLAEQGARNLILVGTKGVVTARSRRLVKELESRGVFVEVCKADIGSAIAVHSLFEDRTSTVPIRGVFHLATVYEDRLMRLLKPEQIERGMSAKARGAHYIHELTSPGTDGRTPFSLDFLVLFSSIGGTPGNPGQGPYNAANAFCESLAAYRSYSNLPTIAIGLPAVSGAGVLSWFSARKVISQLQTRGLVGGMAPRGAIFRLLGQILPRVGLPGLPSAILINNDPWDYTFCQNLALFSHLYRSNEKDVAIKGKERQKTVQPSSTIKSIPEPHIEAPSFVESEHFSTSIPFDLSSVSEKIEDKVTKKLLVPENNQLSWLKEYQQERATEQAIVAAVVRGREDYKMQEYKDSSEKSVLKRSEDSASKARLEIALKLAELLGTSPSDEIDDTAPLTDFGVDSLAAVELAAFVSKELEIETSQMEILGGVTISELISRIPNSLIRSKNLNFESAVTSYNSTSDDNDTTPIFSEHFPSTTSTNTSPPVITSLDSHLSEVHYSNKSENESTISDSFARTMILEKLTELLGVETDSVDDNAPLTDLGVDSLAAVELAGYAGKELGIETSQMEILGGVTVSELLSRLPQSPEAYHTSQHHPLASQSVVENTSPPSTPSTLSDYSNEDMDTSSDYESNVYDPPTPSPVSSVYSELSLSNSNESARTLILDKLSELLGLDTTTVDDGAPLTDFGVDSLAAVELAAFLDKELGIQSSQMEILGGVTLGELLSRMQGFSEPTSTLSNEIVHKNHTQEIPTTQNNIKEQQLHYNNTVKPIHVDTPGELSISREVKIPQHSIKTAKEVPSYSGDPGFIIYTGTCTSISFCTPNQNSLNASQWHELLKAVKYSSKLVPLVFTSSDPRYLCTGFDLSSAKFGDNTFGEGLEYYGQLLQAIRDHPQPVICICQGATRGGGMLFPCVSDLVISTSDATFGFPEILHGGLPALVSAGANHRLARHKSLALMLTGRPFNASEALAIGLVDEVHEPGKLEQAVASVLRRMNAADPTLLTMAKARLPVSGIGDGLALYGDLQLLLKNGASLEPEKRILGKDSTVSIQNEGDGIYHLWLSNPARMNMMSDLQIEHFEIAVAHLKELYHSSEGALRVVLLGGQGKNFCAGLDPFSFEQVLSRCSTLPEFVSMASRFFTVFSSLRDVPVPVLAELHGIVIGGGVAMSMTSDWRVCTADTNISAGIRPRGLAFGFQLTQSLHKILGMGRAMGFWLEGNSFIGEAALDYGIVNAVEDNIPAMRARAMELARTIASSPQVGLHSNLLCMRDPVDKALIAREAMGFALAVADLKKRDPTFLRSANAQSKRASTTKVDNRISKPRESVPRSISSDLYTEQNPPCATSSTTDVVGLSSTNSSLVTDGPFPFLPAICSSNNLPPVLAARITPFVTQMEGASKAGIMPFHQVIKGCDTHALINGQKMITLSSNGDYYGMHGDPRVIEATVVAVKRYSAGSLGPALMTGYTEEADLLEKEFSNFLGTEAAMFYSMGFASNATMLPALLTQGDVAFSDAKNHASIIDGLKLSGCTLCNYNTNDMNHLRLRLEKNRNVRGLKLIITDATFSTSGQLCNLPELHRLARQYNALLVLDEAHSMGLCGPNGRGIEEHYNMIGCCDLKTGSFGKSFGALGGYVSGRRDLITFLQYRSRGYVFSGAISPVQAAAARAALRILRTEPWRISKTKENAAYFAEELRQRGFIVEDRSTESAIVNIPLGKSDEIAMRLCMQLRELGYFAVPFLGEGPPFMRCTISGALNKTDLLGAAEACAAVAHDLGIISLPSLSLAKIKQNKRPETPQLQELPSPTMASPQLPVHSPALTSPHDLKQNPSLQVFPHVDLATQRQEATSFFQRRLEQEQKASDVRNVGILAFEVYTPETCVATSTVNSTLSEQNHYTSFSSDSEDTVSLSLNAVAALLRRNGVSPVDIGRLEVGCETPVDHSKSIKTFLMPLFSPSGNHDIEGVELRSGACAATIALLDTVSWIGSPSWDGRYGIIVSVDDWGCQTAGEQGGMVATAMLIGPNAPMIINPKYGAATVNVCGLGTSPLGWQQSTLPDFVPENEIEAYMNVLTACRERYGEVNKCQGAPLLRSCDYFAMSSTDGTSISKKQIYDRFCNLEGIPKDQRSSLCFSQAKPCWTLESQIGYAGNASLPLALLSASIASKNINKKILAFAYGRGSQGILFSVDMVGRPFDGLACEMLAKRKLVDRSQHKVMFEQKKSRKRKFMWKPSENSILRQGAYHVQSVEGNGSRTYCQRIGNDPLLCAVDKHSPSLFPKRTFPSSVPLLPKSSTKDVGIIAVECFMPGQAVRMADLENHDGCPGKYTKGLEMKHVTFCGDNEDAVSAVTNCCSSLLKRHGIPWEAIGRLDVGTETPFDAVKPVATYAAGNIAHKTNGSRKSRVIVCDHTNACYAGSAAVLSAIGWVNSHMWDGRYALVCVVDVSYTGVRYWAGFGSVAMLIGPNARVILEHRRTYMDHTWDFWKPAGWSTMFPIVDGPKSMQSYLSAMTRCQETFRDSLGSKDLLSDFDYYVFHTTTPNFLRKVSDCYYANEVVHGVPTSAERKQQFSDKIDKTMLMIKEVGLLYSVAVWANLASLLTTVGPELNGKRICLYSFGSGCTSSMMAWRVREVPPFLNKLVDKQLEQRTFVDPKEYIRIRQTYCDLHHHFDVPIKHKKYTIPERYYLDYVDEKGQRLYKVKNS